ncbi:hypothetical protein FDP41_008592 [Naegleria fowleri]|uniref:Uncharacterized protein n=1 Tax=Naegleria fowleri TaxID=5763 RepID=A0A6A5BGH7_NAEFO|nr:uncharacterized protein FDP41_008592 [Naegleria fowleri]KAF0973088.1 hypothetical protein FDP41_008592 [Naegleria fowleri]
MEKPLEVEENSVASNSIESISSRSLKFKKVYEFPSHTFIPVVPVEFELCSRNIGNKAFSAVFSDSLVSLAITYKDISSLDFVESSLNSIEHYLKTLRPTCEKNGGSLQILTENAEKTYLFESGKFTKVLETSLIKKNSFGDDEMCITIYACCVGYTVMAIFTHIAPSFLNFQLQHQTRGHCQSNDCKEVLKKVRHEPISSMLKHKLILIFHLSPSSTFKHFQELIPFRISVSFDDTRSFFFYKSLIGN